MSEASKVLIALLVLGLAGVGAYSSGQWVLNFFETLEGDAPVVAKKISPVKPKKWRSTKNAALQKAAADESPGPEAEFTFFETLADSSMTKVAGLEGDMRSLQAEPKPVRPQIVKATQPVAPRVVRKAPRPVPAAASHNQRVVMAAAPAKKAPVRRKRAVRQGVPVMKSLPPRTKRVVMAAAPVKKAVPQRVTRVSQPVSMDPLYAVQVSSFRDSKMARELERKLRNKGYETFRMAAGRPGHGEGVRHRVYLGRYRDIGSADTAAYRIRREEALKTMIITLGR